MTAPTPQPRFGGAFFMPGRDDKPCDRCVIVPTPTGACICREPT